MFPPAGIMVVRRLAGDLRIGGPRRDHGDRTLPDQRHLGGPEPQDSCVRVVLGAPEIAQDLAGRVRLDTGHQDRLPLAAQDVSDLDDLLRGLPRAVDDFGKAVAKGTVGVDARVLGVDEGQARQRFEGVFYPFFAPANSIQ